MRVESIAGGGDGVARVEGLAVFVPRTAPGDVIEAEIEEHGRFARGRLLRVLEPSPQRVEPPCEHYVRDRCGGCQIQHMSYGAQLEAKAAVVRDALRRIGGRAAELPPVHASPDQWRYRAKLTLAMRWRGSRWIAGLHRQDRPGEVFDLRDCPITSEPVMRTWREIMAASSLLPRARELRGAVRASEEGAAFVLEGGRSWADARRFADRVPSLRAIWWVPDRGARRVVVDRRDEAHPSASFAQVNPGTAAELRRRLLDLVRAERAATVVDAYAGSGATAVAIAGDGATVVAIEADADAVAWARRHLAPPSRAVRGLVEDVISDTLPADVVIVNPPRAGVHERVTAALEASRPRALFYVSCNPATLARDIGRLPGFRVASVECFDMFPQTAHVETLCALVPEAA